MPTHKPQRKIGFVGKVIDVDDAGKVRGVRASASIPPAPRASTRRAPHASKRASTPREPGLALVRAGDIFDPIREGLKNPGRAVDAFPIGKAITDLIGSVKNIVHKIYVAGGVVGVVVVGGVVYNALAPKRVRVTHEYRRRR